MFDELATGIGYFIIAALLLFAICGVIVLLRFSPDIIKERKARKEATEWFWQYPELEIFRDPKEREQYFSVVEVTRLIGTYNREKKVKIWLSKEEDEPLSKRVEKIQKRIRENDYNSKLWQKYNRRIKDLGEKGLISKE